MDRNGEFLLAFLHGTSPECIAFEIEKRLKQGADPKLSMTAATQVRLACAEDALDVARLIEQVFTRQLAKELDSTARTAFRMYVTSSALRQRLADGSVAMVVAQDSSVCGYAELCDRRTGGPGFDHLGLFFVGPDQQRHGFGRSLLNAVLDRIQQSGSAVSMLSVNSSRFAEPIYRRLGFKPLAGRLQTADPFSISMALSIKNFGSVSGPAKPPPNRQ